MKDQVERQEGQKEAKVERGPVAKKESLKRGSVIDRTTISAHTRFKGEVYVLTEEEGGRHTPFFSGYRPHFYFRTTDITGVAKLPDGVEMVMPGDNVTLEVELIAPIAMEKGTRFAIREGSRTVGAGTVVAILKDTETYSDPWDEVDEPLSAAEAAEAIAFAEAETEAFRQTILKDCVNATEASRLSGCSRQLLDRLRRERRLIALRADNRWYYPRWQFEPSAPDGILPGLEEVLRRLYLSPAGAAFWLLQPSEPLGGITPLELLRRHQPETVVQLAEEQGYMP